METRGKGDETATVCHTPKRRKGRADTDESVAWVPGATAQSESVSRDLTGPCPVPSEVGIISMTIERSWVQEPPARAGRSASWDKLVPWPPSSQQRKKL